LIRELLECFVAVGEPHFVVVLMTMGLMSKSFVDATLGIFMNRSCFWAHNDTKFWTPSGTPVWFCALIDVMLSGHCELLRVCVSMTVNWDIAEVDWFSEHLEQSPKLATHSLWRFCPVFLSTRGHLGIYHTLVCWILGHWGASSGSCRRDVGCRHT
jgi:hypothetical protein